MVGELIINPVQALVCTRTLLQHHTRVLRSGGQLTQQSLTIVPGRSAGDGDVYPSVKGEEIKQAQSIVWGTNSNGDDGSRALNDDRIMRLTLGQQLRILPSFPGEAM